MYQSHLEESSLYLTKREELRQAEIELMRQREQVAALRRGLPPGPAVQDYVFEEGPRRLGDGDSPVTNVKLSELFTAPDRALILYHFMYGKEQSSPCPMCTMWIDGFDGVAHHVEQNIDFAVVAKGRPRERGRSWTSGLHHLGVHPGP